MESVCRRFLFFSGIGFVVLFLLQLAQGRLPLNPQGYAAVRWDTALNTAISFVTNTNWQAYGGEIDHELPHPDARHDGAELRLGRRRAWRCSCRSSAAFTSKLKETVGNFWVDMTRAVLYVLLPLSIILAVALVSQGVVQTSGLT